MRTISLSPANLSNRYQLVIGNKVVFLTAEELMTLKSLLEKV